MPPYEDELAQIVAELNRASPSGGPRQHSPESLASLDQLLAQAVRKSASDLLLIAGTPAHLRVGGSLTPTGGPLNPEEIRNLLLPLLTVEQNQELLRTKSADLCFSREGIGRFRANIHHQRGTIAGSIRVLPEKIPTLESLHLPPILRKLADARQGLVLITGKPVAAKVPHWPPCWN